VGILSIDVDGNDYWLWKAIEVIHPRIVACEFNRRFGCERAVTTPYNPVFRVSQAHPSRLYYGASLPALCLLAEEKGYDFVGCTSEGVNAFFVRQDLPTGLPAISAKDSFRSIGERGEFGVTAAGGLGSIEHMEVYDLENERLILLRDLPLTQDSRRVVSSNFK
jgi:hypothetical protein